MTGTLITSEVDFDANGKQVGFLRSPHSINRLAYGWLAVPITVIRNGDGPTPVISAGVHGGEDEGPIAVANLARALDAAEIRGRLILLPMVNFPAAEAGLATLTEAFDPPYAWVFNGGGGRSSTARSAMGAANRKGVVNVMAERGDAVYQIAADAV